MLPSYHFCTIQNHHNDQKLQQINSSSTTTTNTKAQQANAVSTLHISNTSTVVHDYLQLNKGKRTVSLVHNSACINNGTVQSTKSALIKLEQKHTTDVYKHWQQTLCYPKTQSTFFIASFSAAALQNHTAIHSLFLPPCFLDMLPAANSNFIQEKSNSL